MLKQYVQYLTGEIDRSTLYSKVPKEEMDTVINKAISDENNSDNF